MDIKTYYNPKIKEVVSLNILYQLSSPLAKLFLKYSFKPNTITTFSNISAVIAIISIFYNFYIFAFFWIFALILDICDGTVARATVSSNIEGSFYDHISDVVKILLLYFSIALYYDSKVIWILISLNFIVFSLIDYLDLIVHRNNLIIKWNNIDIAEYIKNNNKKSNLFQLRLGELYSIFSNTQIFKNIFIMHGQFNLILLPLAYNEVSCKYILVLVLLIILDSIRNLLYTIFLQNKVIIDYNLSWK